MAWRVLEAAPRGQAQEPTINISATGRLTWSKPVAAAMGNPSHVELLHDVNGQRLGVRPADDGCGLRVQSSGRSIETRRTLRLAGIWDRLELPIIGRPALQDADGVWAISVKPDLPIKRRRRKLDGYLDDDVECK